MVYRGSGGGSAAAKRAPLTERSGRDGQLGSAAEAGRGGTRIVSDAEAIKLHKAVMVADMPTIMQVCTLCCTLMT